MHQRFRRYGGDESQACGKSCQNEGKKELQMGEQGRQMASGLR